LLDLGRKRAGQPAQCPPGTVLPSDVFRIDEVMGTSHRHHMNANHLGHQHGFDAIPGLDAPDHRNHEGEIDFIRPLALHAGLHQLPEDTMHRIGIGDPQCVSHELFAEIRIRMVDAKSMGQELYPRRCGGPGLAGCGWCCLVEVRRWVHVDISSGMRIEKCARLGNARGDPSLWRAGATSTVVEDFLPAIAPASPVPGRTMGVFTNGAMMQLCR
jgi:hypothetical protein